MNAPFTLRLQAATRRERARIAELTRRLPRSWRWTRELARLRRLDRYLARRLERP